MKVVVARTAGFCWGVKRAMDAVLEASARSNGNAVSTLGPLIHNPQALELLSQRGVTATEDASTFKGGTLVVRAHGIPIQELRQLKERQAKREITLVNATCPEVAKVHAKIRKWSQQGYYTVILGSHGHAESLAHRSFAENSSIVSSVEEAKALPEEHFKKVLVVAQTTFTMVEFENIVAYIKERAGELVVENTICKDTWTRQVEAQQIAASADAVVIVGGKNSSNTRHLAELARKHGKPCQFVETAAEMDLELFRGLCTVGVLAGASTPTWLVEEVVFALKQLDKGAGAARRSLEIFARPLFLGLGAAAMALGIHTWMGSPKTWQYPLITGAYLFAMYLLTPFLDPKGLGAKGPARAKMLENSRRAMTGLGILSLISSLAVAWFQGPGSMFIVLMAAVFGLLYKRSLRFGKYRLSLAAIPGSKDIMIALALGVVAVALPLWHHDWHWNALTWTAIFQVTVIAFANSTIHNIKDMQNDQILGRETLPILIGRQAAKAVLLVVTLLAFAASVYATFAYQVQSPWRVSFLFAFAGAYPMLHLWLFHERFRAGKARVELPLELSFFLIGLLAFLS